DSTPSLHIRPGKAGSKRLFTFRCYAGCEPDRILEALGLTWADIYGDEHRAMDSKQGKSDLGALAAEYVYRDEAGAPLSGALRLEKDGKKASSQQRADGTGGWLKGKKNMAGCRRVVYGWPQVLAAEEDTAVYFVEGEKAVDRLRAHGVVVVTTS